MQPTWGVTWCWCCGQHKVSWSHGWPGHVPFWCGCGWWTPRRRHRVCCSFIAGHRRGWSSGLGTPPGRPAQWFREARAQRCRSDADPSCCSPVVRPSLSHFVFRACRACPPRAFGAPALSAASRKRLCHRQGGDSGSYFLSAGPPAAAAGRRGPQDAVPGPGQSDVQQTQRLVVVVIDGLLPHVD